MLKAEFTFTGDQALFAELKRLEKKLARKVAVRGIRAGMKFLATKAKARFAKDTGVAAKAITVRVSKKKKRGVIALDLIFKTEPVLAQAKKGNPHSKAYPDGFFYPAIEEYGSAKLNRAPKAPIRTTYENDGPAAAETAITSIRADIQTELG